ncbi:NAD(P)-dependent oxidoreductase [Chromobacterium phragmitis]|uniref:NAD(P)-dependent oxidoreductase n=1 Tax=Chromobacterium phragmitis TaxID=2202141 RepID=A0ABV0IUI9_9NEIS
MPPIQLLIPDDDQNIGPEPAELHRDPCYRCASVGDLSRLPDADAALAEADALSLHQRLVPATEGNVGPADLAAMKPDALLVNASRAELIAPGALEAALDAGRPGFAALDVFEQEPVYDPNHPLLLRPNVLCSPHLGYAEEASYRQYLEIAYRNAARFFDGDTSHVLNPEILI